MKKVSGTLILTVFVASISFGQIWQPLGNGFSEANSGGPEVFYIDPSTSKLVIGGGFTDTTNGDTLVKICTWDGQQFESIGCGVDWECGGEFGNFPGGVNTIVTRDTEILISGGIYESCGIPISRTVQFNGNCWENFGTYNLGISQLKMFGDTLYGSGIDVDGIHDCNGLAKWGGSSWLPVNNLNVLSSSQEVFTNNIITFEFFQSDIYIGGNWNSGDENPGMDDLAMWNGNEWTSVGNGLSGSLSYVDKMVVFQDKLIVGGRFSGPNNPGNGIAAWDGTSWDNMDGGFLDLDNPQGPPTVLDMWATEDYLYVVGQFYYAGGIPAHSVARWDGENWCGYGAGPYFDDYFYWDNTVRSVCFYNGDLIVGGNFQNAGNDTGLNLIAKYVGPGSCLTSGINEQPRQEGITIFPNPALNSLTISTNQHFSPSTQIQFFDLSGRLILTEQIQSGSNKMTIDVGNLSPGIYTCVVSDKNEKYKPVKWVKE